jgi:hypothetical protein
LLSCIRMLEINLLTLSFPLKVGKFKMNFSILSDNKKFVSSFGLDFVNIMGYILTHDEYTFTII